MGLSKKFFYLLAILLLAAVGLGIKVFLGRGPARAAIRVDSFPRSEVIINDKEVGQTPFSDEKIIAGEYTIKLVPKNSSGDTLVPWQTKIKLSAGTLTYLSRDIAPTEEQSAGQILMLEQLASGKSAELAVISSPDGAKISIDGLDKGRSPLVLRDISAGGHEIVISADGYSDQKVSGKIVAGYRLNVIVKLGSLPNGQTATGSAQIRSAFDLIASQSGQELARPYVVVKDTPTGFLRVRIDPIATATEVGQIKPGEKYSLLAETSGWVKIKLPNIFGWVSDQYVEKIE